jgi:glycine/D-amino acid oxidase-like deaminating enzyme
MPSPSTAPSRSPRKIVIIGGGIIGSCTAYYLTRHPTYDPNIHSITLLEANAIASGASGKAGGLLAKWAYPTELVDLSWRLHESLAAEHVGEKIWGFRRVDVGEVSLKGRAKEEMGGMGEGNGLGEGVSLQKRSGRSKSTSMSTAETPQTSPNPDITVPPTLNFFHNPNIRSYTSMGSPANTAQVHPYQFTTSMASLAIAKGAKLVLGKGIQMLRDENGGNVVGVKYVDKASQDERILQATDVIIAAGPWSGTAGVWPGPPGKGKVGGLRAHSVVVRPAREVAPWAVFSRIELPDEGNGKRKMGRGKKRQVKFVAPEIYTRPDNTVYVCGEGDTDVPLPKAGTVDVEIDDARCEEIINAMGSVSDVLGQGDVLVRQACYLPVVEGGDGPLVGVTKTQGVLLATGHSCWGIMNGPATGLLMSEFVFDGRARSADVRALDPRGWL